MDIKWLWRTWRGKFLHLPFSHDRRGGKGRGGGEEGERGRKGARKEGRLGEAAVKKGRG